MKNRIKCNSICIHSFFYQKSSQFFHSQNKCREEKKEKNEIRCNFWRIFLSFRLHLSGHKDEVKSGDVTTHVAMSLIPTGRPVWYIHHRRQSRFSKHAHQFSHVYVKYLSDSRSLCFARHEPRTDRQHTVLFDLFRCYMERSRHIQFQLLSILIEIDVGAIDWCSIYWSVWKT